MNVKRQRELAHSLFRLRGMKVTVEQVFQLDVNRAIALGAIQAEIGRVEEQIAHERNRA